MTEQTHAISPARPPAPRENLIALLVVLAGLAAAVLLGLASEGVYHDDDICHYLYARDSWGDAHVMLHWWARPGYNIPTMFVAHFFGMGGCRVFSAIMTAVVAWLAYLIARRIGVKPGLAILAPAIVWLQPLTMTLAATTLTETPAALYLTLAVWLYLRGNRVWACLAMSPAFVTRLETLALAPIIAVAVILDALREADWKPGRMLRTPWPWQCAAALLWAPAMWCAAAYAVNVPRDDSPIYVLFKEHTKEYSSGNWYDYLIRWPEAAGLGIAAAAVAGAVALRRRGWMVSAFAFGLVGLHGALWYKGAFATGGYARFLVPGSAFVAVLAAAGLPCIWRGRNRLAVASAAIAAAALFVLIACKYPQVIAPGYWQAYAMALSLTAVMAIILAVTLFAKTAKLRLRAGQLTATILVVLVAVQVGLQVRPFTFDANPDGAHIVMSKAVAYIDKSEYRDNPAVSQHVLVRFLRDEAETKLAGSNAEAIDAWRTATPGTMFFWESKYCYKPHEPDSTNRLYKELMEWGTLVYRNDLKGVRVEVYKREAVWQGPVKGPPKAPTTRPTITG